MLTKIPGIDGPPWAMIPSYMTVFQSSPVRIWNIYQQMTESFFLKISLKSFSLIQNKQYFTSDDSKLHHWLLISRAKNALHII